MKETPSFPKTSLLELKNCVRFSHLSLSKEATIIFVCGAKPDQETPTARDFFLEYAKKHLKAFQFFMAEDFFKFYDRSPSKDLLSVEGDIAKYCDCLMIFLESASAIAELGAFATNDKSSEIMIVINDVGHRDSGSFIAQGPIAKLDRISKFKPMIYSKMNSVLGRVKDIENRLTRIEKKRKRRVDLSSYQAFIDANPKLRMLFLFDLINIFGPIKFAELIYLLQQIFEEQKHDISIEVNMLVTLGLVQKIENYLRVNPDRSQRFYVYEATDVVKIRSMIIRWYFKYLRDRFKHLPNYHAKRPWD